MGQRTNYAAPPESSAPVATNHWIGLRENLQETMVFTIKYSGFL